jgi:GDP-L-fucose synthase
MLDTVADNVFDLDGRRVWVTGHRGMVGSALCRRLVSENCEILTVARRDVDLTRQRDVEAWMTANRPDVVIVSAARVGGIVANATFPAEFLYENMMISANVIWAAHESDVEKLLFLGSSCIYPKAAAQPIHEESLLTGMLEPTNEAYAIAKIAGLKLARAINTQYGRRYISAMPTNLYGPLDNFDLTTSHVVPALMRKIHEARSNGSGTVSIWGSGTPTRDLLHVDDLANACIYLLRHYDGAEPVNAGSGSEISIQGLAELLAEIIGFEGKFEFDLSKPDGTPRKMVDIGRIRALGWQPQIALREGLESTYMAWSNGGREAWRQRSRIAAAVAD